MKRWIIITGLLITAIASIPTNGLSLGEARAKMSPSVLEKAVNKSGKIRVVAFVHSDSDFLRNSTQFAKSVRQTAQHASLVNQLKSHANKNVRVSSLLDSLIAAGRITDFKRFWITSAFAFEADSDVLDLISSEDEVTLLVEDMPLELVAPISTGTSESGLAGSDALMEQIGVRELWAMGYSGHGRLVCGFDTGVEGTHPALASRWLGNTSVPASQSWYDPFGTTAPVDLNGHGTHTMGLMVGRDGVDTIGVAFNANWMAAGVIDRGQNLNKTVSDILGAFQWAADPDQNPLTSDDLPDVVCNSWGIPKGLFEACDETFYEAIDNLEALGVVVIFACGNEGPNPGTIRNPADRASSPTNSFSVGAVDQTRADLMIANFSSRGPANCDTTKIKPEIVAPGVNLRSSYKGGAYRTMSGTSMAAPIVAGCVALMREYNPDATVEQIKNALIQSAEDLGLAGKDNEYGFGFINVRRAIEFLPEPLKPRVLLEGTTLEPEEAVLNIGATTPMHLTVASNSLPINGLVGVLRCDNPHVFLLSNTASFGNLPSESLGDNTSAPFMIKIDHSALPGEQVQFTAEFQCQQYGYLNSVDFTLTFGQPVLAASDVISTSRINGEVTNYGVSHRLYDQSAGQDLLAHLGLFVSTTDGAIYDAIPGDLDFIASDSLRKSMTATSTSIRGEYSTGDDIVIAQNSSVYDQLTLNNFVILEFDATSAAASSTIDFLGLSIDIDLSGGEQVVRNDDDLIIRSTNYDRFVGIRALPAGEVVAVSFSGTECKSGIMTDQAKRLLLDSRDALDPAIGDMAAVFGLSISDLDATSTVKAGFVIATGNSMDEISVALQAGEQRYLQATDTDDDTDVLPTLFALDQNYPNPFNAETQIGFYLPKAGSYTLEIFNTLGQSVREYVVDQAAAGVQSLIWDGKDGRGADVATGIYFYRLAFDGNTATRKMVLLK